MRELLLENGEMITVAVTIVELILTLILLYDCLTKRKLPILLMLLVTFGLTLDAAVLALGNMLPEQVLAVLSRIRYAAHGLLVPLTVLLCGYIAEWEFTLKMKLLTVITALLCIAGLCAGLARVTAVECFAGVCRFAPTDETPAWSNAVNRLISFGTVLPLIAAGGYAVWKRKGLSILLGGLLMLLCSVLAPATGNADLIFLISMPGELCMALSFLIYEKKAYKREQEYY